MTDVLLEFPHLKDPKSGATLINRTVLIANTSNMPVAAREASVYTGITIAEYFRDMGYSVAVMADSTSRWAEAMREISGRLEEMPGEEGYPAYLGTRIAEFYERSGRVSVLCSGNREGNLSTIGAVSPPGGDLSDPVVQATLRVVKVFWSLEDKLAFQRHFPAISWLNSYSLYHENLEASLRKEVAHDIVETRQEAMKILQEEAELAEIVKLVGVDSLSPGDRITLETARSLREDFLHQNAFHEVDSYCSSKKMNTMLKLILKLHHLSLDALHGGVPFEELAKIKVKEDIARSKYIPEDQSAQLDKIARSAESEIEVLKKMYSQKEVVLGF
jgi:V/A-type H+-transporting ATPase subunit A